MPKAEWPKTWQRIDKHRKATVRTWRSGEAQAWSAQNESQAQYNPIELGTDEVVRDLEMRCVDEGTLIRETAHKRTYFMHTDTVVGVCCGDETTFVFAEWHDSGIVHGRPISVRALKRFGVKL
ncbi:MAG: hypothetical protein ACREHD_25860 [Pirellulales bacterium]